MAVKASGTITLSSVVDVKATYRYYLLQSSTLARPSKPTTNPPSSSWDDVEPTYTDGSTNTLYTVDLTVFSDNTWSYSEVSISSSYEAAKSAYNKAVNAQNTANDANDKIDNLEIGGRNLLLNSRTQPLWSNNSNLYPTTFSYIEEDDIKFTRIRRTSPELDPTTLSVFGSFLKNTFRFKEMAGKCVTLSFKVRASHNTTMSITSNVYGTTSIKFDKNGVSEPITTEWKTITQTIESFPDLSSDDFTGVRFFPSVIAIPSNLSDPGEFYLDVREWKFELGNKATDWTLAPEDTPSSEDVFEAQSSSAEALSRVVAAEALIQTINDTIAMMVTDGNGFSLMTQTENGYTFNMGDIHEALSKASESLDILTNDVGEVQNTVDILRQAVEDQGAISEYIRISVYESEPCIELGEADSDFKLRITNTRIMFMDGENLVAYITNQSLHIKKAVIEEELQQGKFVWKARSNGNLGLIWKGGNE